MAVDSKKCPACEKVFVHYRITFCHLIKKHPHVYLAIKHGEMPNLSIGKELLEKCRSIKVRQKKQNGASAAPTEQNADIAENSNKRIKLEIDLQENSGFVTEELNSPVKQENVENLSSDGEVTDDEEDLILEERIYVGSNLAPVDQKPSTSSTLPPTNKRKHSPDKKKSGYDCDDCDANYSILEQLVTHALTTHMGNERFTCFACPKRLMTGYRLLEHLNRNHGRKLTCSFCNKTLEDETRFVEHVSNEVKADVRKYYMKQAK